MPECGKKRKMFGFNLLSGLVGPDFFCRRALSASALAASLVAVPGSLAAESALPPSALTPQSSSPSQLPRIRLQAGDHRITAEVAADDASRSRGLMFRERLAPDHGMLFVFPEAAQFCFWMKNTPLPLSIAFIGTQGSIVSLADMQPRSLDAHCAIAPALYALEMEQGWFARHGVRPGTTIHGLPRLAQPPSR